MKTKHAIQRYLWINPVVESMAGRLYEDVLEQVRDRGFIPVSCSTGAETVLRQYRNALETRKEKILIDSRCPLIVDWIDRKYPELQSCQAQVLPILLTCATELYKQYIEVNPVTSDLTMATPCTALVRQGNSCLGDLANFVTWKQFCVDQELRFEFDRASGSPIPPGFFNFPGYQIWEANGIHEVATMFEKVVRGNEGPDLLELLYCEGGCHNGDGV